MGLRAATLQGRIEKCVRPGATESGNICKSYEYFEETVRTAWKGSKYMWCVESVLRGAD